MTMVSTLMAFSIGTGWTLSQPGLLDPTQNKSQCERLQDRVEEDFTPTPSRDGSQSKGSLVLSNKLKLKLSILLLLVIGCKGITKPSLKLHAYLPDITELTIQLNCHSANPADREIPSQFSVTIVYLSQTHHEHLEHCKIQVSLPGIQA